VRPRRWGAQYNLTVRSQSGLIELKNGIHPLSSVYYISTKQTVGRSRIGTCVVLIRGKSGLRWTGCQVTPGRGQRERFATESATENRPPSSQVARVKRWGKSPPRSWQHGRHGKPQLRARPNMRRETSTSIKTPRVGC